MKKRTRKKRISIICRKIRMARRRGWVGIGRGLNIRFFKLPEEEVQYRQYVARFQCQQSKEQKRWILDEAYKMFTK
jgi:hypothetical protein